MKRRIYILSLGLSLTAIQWVEAQVPGILSYQGYVAENGGHFSGTGYFKFAVIGKGGILLPAGTFWSNDGSSTAGSEPDASVPVSVDQGLFTVALGDASLENMTPIPAEVFSHGNLFLRVWFSSESDGVFTQFVDHRITSVGYAMMSANVEDGAITAEKIAADAIETSHLADNIILEAQLADGSVTTPKLADEAVTGDKLAHAIHIGDANLHYGSLGVFNNNGSLAIRLGGLERSVLLYGDDGDEESRLKSGGGGKLSLRGPDAVGLQPNPVLAELDATAADGGLLTLNDASGGPGLKLFGNAPSPGNGSPMGVGGIDVSDGTTTRATLRGTGRMNLYRDNGDKGLSLEGHGASNGAEMKVWDAASALRMHLEGNSGALRFFEASGIPSLHANGGLGDFIARNHIGVAPSVDAVLLRASLGYYSEGGLVRTRDEHDHTMALMGADAEGGFLNLYREPNPDATNATIVIDADGYAASGQITMRRLDGLDGVVLYASAPDNGAGAMSLRDANGQPRLQAYGGPASGSLWIKNSPGIDTIALSNGDNEEGLVSVRNKFGGETVYLRGRNGGDTDSGQIGLKNAEGDTTITLDADRDGEGRIITEVLEITGGSDLSEQFKITAAERLPEPGMLVCIDPARPGRLVLSRRAYDRTAAGVVSGAGGVKPGMIMGQSGSIAEGEYPVAMTGRVYCLVDASFGAVEPGDLITTSETSGHGMKVTDYARAQGAIVGKAMTGLVSGRGLVLVLVSLQ